MSSSGPTPKPRSTGRVGDHLANERTFLAWIRTALGLIGLGFVLARMGLFLRSLALAGGMPRAGRVPPGGEFLVIGLVFLALGTGFCGWSGWIYDRNRRAIDEDRYEPARRQVLSLTTSVVIGGRIIVGLVLWH